MSPDREEQFHDDWNFLWPNSQKVHAEAHTKHYRPFGTVWKSAVYRRIPNSHRTLQGERFEVLQSAPGVYKSDRAALNAVADTVRDVALVEFHRRNGDMEQAYEAQALVSMRRAAKGEEEDDMKTEHERLTKIEEEKERRRKQKEKEEEGRKRQKEEKRRARLLAVKEEVEFPEEVKRKDGKEKKTKQEDDQDKKVKQKHSEEKRVDQEHSGEERDTHEYNEDKKV